MQVRDGDADLRAALPGLNQLRDLPADMRTTLGALREDAHATLAAASAALADEAVPFTIEDVERVLREVLIDGLGLKPRLAFAPLRVALSGRRISPPLFESMVLLGRDETVARLRRLMGRI